MVQVKKKEILKKSVSQIRQTDLRKQKTVKPKHRCLLNSPHTVPPYPLNPANLLFHFNLYVWRPLVPSVLLPGKSHGGRSLVGCNPWGC